MIINTHVVNSQTFSSWELLTMNQRFNMVGLRHTSLYLTSYNFFKQKHVIIAPTSFASVEKFVNDSH